MKVTDPSKTNTASLDVCLKGTDRSYLGKSESEIRTRETFVLTHDGSQEQDRGPSKLNASVMGTLSHRNSHI
jgi:hypothetical protein